MDGVAESDFDMIDAFIARHHLDPAVAEEAMAVPSETLARMLVDISVPRAELVRLAHGLTPAKLAEAVAHLNALEIAFAYAKMRSRRTPGNQAHVTNAKDDPLQLAADAATAVALGFDEIETTMRVSRNAWSNALACCVGAAVGRWGTLFQCSSEEAEELAIGMAGFTSYAETVSVYGTEQAFIDGDDTPWSKAFLTAAYASRGIKMRCTSGAGSELLMGFHEAKSMLYLEARCLCMQRAMGAQGTQNGGIDGAPLASTVPGGVRELMAENLIAVWLDLECASGNDARTSESEIRIGAKILPFLLAGSDLICSGMGSILSYDNSFNPSLFNGEQLEDYLVLQRDFEADGGLRPIEETEVLALRRRAVDALGAVLEELDLGAPSAEMKQSVVVASGSNDTQSYSPRQAAEISEAITARKITVIDVVRALHARGFAEEATTCSSWSSCASRATISRPRPSCATAPSSPPSTIPTNMPDRAPATA
jgi:propanediol dehydratase large subunit